MRLVFLLGSGASRPADMPSVLEITARVLSGECVIEGNDSRFRILDEEMFRRQAMLRGRTGDVVAFARELKGLCDAYWESQKVQPRETNYEDIAYVAQQIDDGLTSEYENPALLPLNEKYGVRAGRPLGELRALAALTADYIEDIVCGMLGVPIAPVDHLAAVTAALSDGTIDHITLATLNHDLVLERAMAEAGTIYSDGFGHEYGTLRIWNDAFDPPNRTLLTTGRSTGGGISLSSTASMVSSPHGHSTVMPSTRADLTARISATRSWVGR